MKSIHITEDSAKLILRLTIGFLVLLHGIAKLTNPEAMGFIESLLEKKHLPTFIAYGVYIGEIIAPIMLIIGYRVKCAAGLIAFTLLMAIFLAHMGQIFSLSPMGGGWAIELQALYLFGALALMGLGAGKYVLIREKECDTCTVA